MAADVLLSAMDFYFDDKRPVPMPSAALPGERLIELPPSAAAKVLLLNEMLAQKVSNSELGRRIGASPQEMNRVIDLKHTTKIDTIWRAMAALGKKAGSHCKIGGISMHAAFSLNGNDGQPICR